MCAGEARTEKKERKKERANVGRVRAARIYADVAERARRDTRRNKERGTKGQEAGGGKKKEGPERKRESEREANDGFV